MNKTKKALLLASMLAGSMFTAQGVMAAGITDTKHNLGTGGSGTNHLTKGTGEICVFCHTPHGSDINASVPLWNRVIDLTGFTTYDSLGTSSLDGGIAAVGSVSVACLSCHDGGQAMDVMINQPGSGGYNVGGAADGTNVWAGANKPTGIALIGKDLRNDHPIGIQYAGGGTTEGGFSPTDGDFKTPVETSINSLPIWYLDTGGAGRQKTDLPLYTRGSETFSNKTDSVISEPYVECATCHDPHTDANPTFLRVSNVGSAVCLACHTK
jgi:predicted CXXCH cytochrome family protein